MDIGWLNNAGHDYERDPYWCTNKDKYDTTYIKYKLRLDVREQFTKFVQNVNCDLYDGALKINAKQSLESSGIGQVTHIPVEPEYIMTLNFVGLALNKDHNLHACCNLQVYDPNINWLRSISNEVCFSKEVPRIKCAVRY